MDKSSTGRSAGVRAGVAASVGWQVTLRSHMTCRLPLRWGASLTAIHCLYLYLFSLPLQSYPTTDNYTSTGRIWVTLNMAGVLRTIMKLSGNFTLSAEWSPCKQFRAMFAVDGRPTSAFQRTHSRTHRITLNNSKPCLLPHRKLHPTVNLAEAAAALPGYLLISLWTG